MAKETLTKEQELFLEECVEEFSERFTDSDEDYKKTYDNGVPPPPIMCPWNGKSRYNNRDRPGGSRYENNFRYRNSHQENNYRDGHRQNEHRFRPY